MTCSRNLLQKIKYYVLLLSLVFFVNNICAACYFTQEIDQDTHQKTQTTKNNEKRNNERDQALTQVDRRIFMLREIDGLCWHHGLYIPISDKGRENINAFTILNNTLSRGEDYVILSLNDEEATLLSNTGQLNTYYHQQNVRCDAGRYIRQRNNIYHMKASDCPKHILQKIIDRKTR